MTLKIAPATTEEYVFAQEVNKRLTGTGASVHAFTMVNPENQAQTYHLTLQCSGKRKVLTSDAGPFHLDSPDDVVVQVKQWIAGATLADRWTTDLERADAEPA